jgi:hypothetical protein
VHATCRPTAGAICGIQPTLHEAEMIYSLLPQAVQAYSAMKMLET